MWVYLLLVLFYMENYSFLTLCNRSERTTGKINEGVAGGIKSDGWSLWQLGPLSAGFPRLARQICSRISLWTAIAFQLSTSESMKWVHPALLMSEWLGVGCKQMQPLFLRAGWPAGGAFRVLGVAAALPVWLLFHSLHVHQSLKNPWIPGLACHPRFPNVAMHWLVTLVFSWHCQHKYLPYSSKPCFQKKPSKVKETPCS